MLVYYMFFLLWLIYMNTNVKCIYFVSEICNNVDMVMGIKNMYDMEKSVLGICVYIY